MGYAGGGRHLGCFYPRRNFSPRYSPALRRRLRRDGLAWQAVVRGLRYRRYAASCISSQTMLLGNNSSFPDAPLHAATPHEVRAWHEARRGVWNRKFPQRLVEVIPRQNLRLEGGGR